MCIQKENYKNLFSRFGEVSLYHCDTKILYIREDNNYITTIFKLQKIITEQSTVYTEQQQHI